MTLGGAVDASTQSETWEDGIAKGLKRVAVQTATDGALEAATGGILDGSLEKIGQKVNHFKQVKMETDDSIDIGDIKNGDGVNSSKSDQRIGELNLDAGGGTGPKPVHTKPEEADRLIRKFLEDEVKGAVKEGKEIAGKVKFYSDEEWHVLIIPFVKNNPSVKGANAFHDPNTGLVHVHEDRGNLGTVIHEAIHIYGDPKRKLKHLLEGAKKSTALYEGITEYFTLKVMNDAKVKLNGRNSYLLHQDPINALVAFGGEEMLSKAYFQGDIKPLQNFLESRSGEGALTEFAQKIKNNDWEDAKDLVSGEPLKYLLKGKDGSLDFFRAIKDYFTTDKGLEPNDKIKSPVESQLPLKTLLRQGGRELLAKAYFDKNIQPLKDYVESKSGEGALNKFAEYMRDKKYFDASNLVSGDPNHDLKSLLKSDNGGGKDLYYGFREFLYNQISKDMGIKPDKNSKLNEVQLVIETLANTVGVDKIANAFYEGDISQLENAMIARLKDRKEEIPEDGVLKALALYIENKDWYSANDLSYDMD